MRAMARARRMVASSPAPPTLPAPLALASMLQSSVLQMQSLSFPSFVTLHFLLSLTAV